MPTTEQRIESLQAQMNDRMDVLAEENLRLKRSAKHYTRWSMLLILLASVGLFSYAWAASPLAEGAGTGLVKTDFADGNVISAADFNTNFKSLVGKTNELVTEVNANTAAISTQVAANTAAITTLQSITTIDVSGEKISAFGVYCGETGNQTGAFSAAGGRTGLDAARFLCQSACGNSPTAHMCSAHEVGLSLQIGLEPTSTDVWFNSMIWSHNGVSGEQVNNCQAWTSDLNTVAGHALSKLSAGKYQPNPLGCGSQHPIACCDFP